MLSTVTVHLRAYITNLMPKKQEHSGAEQIFKS